MSVINAETLSTQAEALPITEQRKLFASLRAKLEPVSAPANGVKTVAPIAMPDPLPNQIWMNEHAHEYGGQWVALDGDRLIAHGTVAAEIYAAARADGAYLPLITFIPPADAPPFIGL